MSTESPTTALSPQQLRTIAEQVISDALADIGMSDIYARIEHRAMSAMDRRDVAEQISVLIDNADVQVAFQGGEGS
jgi:hypothetical protein